jgi:hypothetical protein
MSLAGLFPEVPSLQFQVVDTTAGASNATSVLTGSPSTSRGASRPQTAGSRPLTGKSGGVMNLSSGVKQAMYQAFAVSAADCLHVCHAHLTDPANFWKSINDAYVEQQHSRALWLSSASSHVLQVCNIWCKTRACIGAGLSIR